MIEMGERVTPKDEESGAHGFTGKVTGISPGEAYASMMEQLGVDMTPWNKKYQGWQFKKVFQVEFDLILRTISFDGWVRQAVAKGQTVEFAKSDYRPSCPQRQIFCFPEDDLNWVSR